MTARGTVVVVTGATRGIGLGLAKELLKRNARVVICGRSQESVDKALAELGGGALVSGVPCDVSKPEDLQRLWDHAVEKYGKVDHWVNNAGMGVPRKPLTELDPAEIDRICLVNLAGIMHGTAVPMRGMDKQGGGIIWNMEGFGSGGQMSEMMSVYGATKRAVNYFTASMIKDQKNSKVGVAFMSPGIVKTDLLIDDYAGQPELFEKSKKFFNILGDTVEDVTPMLAEGLLTKGKNGARVEWLSTGKAAGRFFSAFVLRRKRHVFDDVTVT
jgi:NAD(P)-dependent dehydrogenase (short-subunit alcohol dehydrogenase family)